MWGPVEMSGKSMGSQRRMQDRKSDDNATGTSVVTKTKPKTKKPDLYRVLLLNDDYWLYLIDISGFLAYTAACGHVYAGSIFIKSENLNKVSAALRFYNYKN